MNESLQAKLSEVVGGNNISYILNDNKDFSVTGYKVMQNHGSSGLLRCAKVMYNGHIKLTYIIGEAKSLSYVAARLGVNELNMIIFGLIQRALEIKANGFFSAENIELDFNKIYVDTKDYSVHLIYFPINNDVTGKMTSFENEFRVALIKLFNSYPVFNAPQFQKLCIDLANGVLPLEAILKKVQGESDANMFDRRVTDDTNLPNYFVPAYGSKAPAKPQMQPPLTITAIHSPMPFSLTVTQSEFTIGKNPSMVNGAITYNPAISRVHCKISYSMGKYCITDLGSANGTYVNNQRLEKQQTVEIHNNTHLKLANSEFTISF